MATSIYSFFLAGAELTPNHIYYKTPLPFLVRFYNMGIWNTLFQKQLQMGEKLVTSKTSCFLFCYKQLL